MPGWPLLSNDIAYAVDLGVSTAKGEWCSGVYDAFGCPVLGNVPMGSEFIRFICGMVLALKDMRRFGSVDVKDPLAAAAAVVVVAPAVPLALGAVVEVGCAVPL